MKEENKCDSPFGGWWRECEKFDKKGEYLGMGIGKVYADIKYFNREDKSQSEHEYQVCKECLKIHMFDHESDDGMNNMTEVNYRDGRPSVYPNAKIILIK